MSALETKGFSQIVGTIAAGMQGRVASRFLNFALGSMLRAIAEAYAGILLWLQKENLDTVKLTRLATSFGSDVDSFVADFPLSGVSRIGAQPATGLCVFGRYTASGAAIYVPVGGAVKTQDGTQSFQVYADPGNGAFVASYVPPGASAATPLGGYVMPAQVASVTAPVRGITAGVTGAPGANGNVAAGAIALVSSTMPGVDTVTNVAALTNGSDAELDASMKSRFGLAVAGRGGGTVAAYKSAIANLKVGLTCVVLENQNLDGSTNYGLNSVIVDDGSGAISSSLLAAAQTAIIDNNQGVRAAGIRVGVYAATTLPINVVMQVATKPGYVHQVVVAQVVAALGFAINGLGQGSTVGYFAIAGVAANVAGVAEVVPSSYTLNGGAGDIPGTPQTTPKAGALTVS